MEYVYLGKIVNTHGIKGEVRVLSDFERKDLVFKKGFALFIGEKKEKHIINTYRRHKN
ncbi:MAG: ribosome maturation factor RimM, partial [Bacilli bacterium]|nr:ribosome maturation factor RimM [Bacilli bacterium]